MATRATYSIEHDYGIEYFYIHWDNYEEGAAHYFFNMHNAKTKGDCLVTRFIVGNPLAVEFTRNHSQHGDTEYRYDLDKDGNLTVKKEYDGEWYPKFSGHYAEFINRYLPRAYEKKYNEENHKLICYTYKMRPWAEKEFKEWITVSQLKEKACDLYKSSLSFSEDNPNKKIYFDQAKEIDLFLQLIKS